MSVSLIDKMAACRHAARRCMGRRIGPGGIKCTCCRPAKTVKLSRVMLNRLHRRMARQLHAQVCKEGEEP